jgi:predicted RNase H-like HicB family nuclease
LSRHRFEAYLDKVFVFSGLVGDLPEGRSSPRHSWKKVFDAVFLGAAMQPHCLAFRHSPLVHGKIRLMEGKFTAVYEKLDDWYIGYVEELPGANTQGQTLEETRENLREAVQLILEANREIAEKDTAGRNVIREDLLVAL